MIGKFLNRDKNQQPEENQINTDFFLRKNKFFYSEHQFHTGKSTQIVGKYSNFEDVKKAFLNYTKEIIQRLAADGMMMPNKELYHLQRYLMYRNVLQNETQLNQVINSESSLNDIWDGDNYFMSIKSTEEVELFNMLYPTDAYEIIFTNNNYLVMPKWNPRYFELINEEIPLCKLTFDEEGLSDSFLSKGVYVDELDFWANLKRDVNAYGYACSFYDLSVNKIEIVGESSDWISKSGIRIINDKIQADSCTPGQLWVLNNRLKEPPILFDQVPFNEVRVREKETYKELVIESYLANRFLPAFFYSHDEVMGLNNNGEQINFWSELHLTEDIAKEIINENIDIVESRSSKMEKDY